MGTRMRSGGKLLGLMALLTLCGFTISACAQQRILWQIGEFNYSSQEFRTEGVNYNSPKSNVVYTLGKSHAKDWLGFQPGPVNAIAGGRLHPYRVDFALQQTPRGLYQLRIGILYEMPRLSALQLKVHVPQVILRREAGTSLPGFGGPTNRVRFKAADVPAMGYRVFAIVPAKGSDSLQRQALPSALHDLVLENNYYRVTLDVKHGAIKSIYEKQLHRELVSTGSRYAFGAYIFVEGGNHMPANSLYRYGSAQVPPKPTPLESGNGKLVSIKRTARGVTAVLTSSAPNTPWIRTTITLPSHQRAIDISYRFHKTATLKKEAAYVAFPFAGSHPVFRYATQNGWINPGKDELPGGSREWYAVNHWAAMSSDGVTAAVIPEDAPRVTFGSIVRGKWPIAFHRASSTIFSWIMSNYWDTNYASSQDGNYEFRYRIVSTKGFDGSELTRLGWEAMTPLESDMTGASSSRYPLKQTSASFLSVDPNDVVAIAWNLDGKGDGSMLRLEEIAGKSEEVHLESPLLTIEKAWICNALGDKERQLPVGPEGLHLQVRHSAS